MPRPRSRAGRASGRRCAGTAAPIIVQHGFATPGADPLGHFAAGLDGTRRSVIRASTAASPTWRRRATSASSNVAALAGRLGTGHWFDDRGWYMAKMPYAPDALPLLARHTAAVLAARLGLSRRCLVLDLDNTLWGGVIGDDGLDGITLGGGTAGEAYRRLPGGAEGARRPRHRARRLLEERSRGGAARRSATIPRWC